MPIVTAPALPVTKDQRVELMRMAASSSLPHRQVRQAKAMLWAADGVANQEIARRCGVDSDAVRRWRAKFAEKGVAGVGVIAKGRGRKSSLPPGTVAEVLRLTHKERPADGSTHWSTRTMAARVGIGKDAVAKIWADHNRTRPRSWTGTNERRVRAFESCPVSPVRSPTRRSPTLPAWATTPVPPPVTDRPVDHELCFTCGLPSGWRS